MSRKTVPRLAAGSRVAIVSPSWGGPSLFPSVFERGLANLRQIGLVPIEYPTARMSDQELRRNPKIRADDLNRAFCDPLIDGVIASIGGDDSIRILEHLDPQVFRENPKFIIGYSDSTTFLNFIADAGVVSFYGPSVMSGFAQWHNFPPEVHRHFFEMIFDGGTPVWGENRFFADGYPDWSDASRVGQLNPMQPSYGWRWSGGKSGDVTEGVLWGGCIEVLEMMKGTRFWPSTWSDRILFLETSEDVPTIKNVSYWLQNYGVQGVFSEISALLIARPRGYTEDQKIQLDQVISRVVREEFGAEDLLVVTNMDFGHTDPQWVMPIGGRVRLDVAARTMSLTQPVCH